MSGCCHDHAHVAERKARPAWLVRDRQKTLAAYVPIEVATAVRERAAREGVSINSIVRQVLVERFGQEVSA